MKVSGKPIAEEIRENLKRDIEGLRSREITPKIAIITLGAESSWEKYVAQKIKVAGELGIEAELINLKDTNEETLLKKIEEIDQSPSYQGLIVQRPMPEGFSKDRVTNAISPGKDVDGFRTDSPFEVPVWLAVRRLIGTAINELGIQKTWQDLNFVVIGKGETAGTPTINGLKNMGIEPQVIDTKTENKDELLKNADVIISCAGKSRVVTAELIKPGAILIGVGTHTEDGKLKGDYVEAEIETVAGAYTPTPGGVGPVNLSYLFANLIKAPNVA